MKTGKRHIWWIAILLWNISACTNVENPDNGGLTNIQLSLNIPVLTKASSNIGNSTHSVDRVLVLPFQKQNLSLPNSRADNFVPVWSLARQFNISTFPSSNLSFTLEGSKTYKVVVIGYNHADYDHNVPMANSNRINITLQPQPTTLANFQLYPKLPNEVPEFFMCYAQVSGQSGVNVFIPASGVNLTGKLGRIISGLGVKITNVPAYVKSITLSADNMIKAVRLVDTTASVVQVPGDNENRNIRTQNVSANMVDFGEFLLPSGTANKMRFYLDIKLGTLTQRYTINLEDSSVSKDGKLILNPNQVIKITGNYNTINYGFVVTEVINLEDNIWDGITPNPAP